MTSLLAIEQKAAAAAASGSEQAAATEPTPTILAPACPRATLHPQLFMAARRADTRLLRHLLQLNDEEEEAANAVRNGGILEANGATTNQGDLLLQVSDSETEVDDDRRSPAPSPAASRGDDAPPPPPPPPVEPLSADGVTIQGDSLLHVVAACGDCDHFLECAEMIYGKESRLLVARNTKGDTPLHCAAGAGNANMISRLIFLAARDLETSVETLVRMQNECGETALHQAVRAARNKVVCIDKLMAVDPELACIPHDEDGGASPLYLAISLGEMEIAGHLLDKTKGKLSYCGPRGRNVLHAAVSRGQAEALHLVLGGIRAAADMRQRQGQEGHADVHLLLQLTGQRDKENGSTPLHLAASLGGLPSPKIMFKTHPHHWRWSGSPARLLLEANESMAYQPDKGGLYPIHVAAGAGSVSVVKILMERCPDCATLRDAKGRTFLHVAVEKRRRSVVRFVLQQRRRHIPAPADAAVARLLSSILNAQDINGDTALHRAVHIQCLIVFFSLARNQMVHLDVKNKEGMTPIDVAWREMPLGVYFSWDPRIVIRNYLLQVGAPYGKNWGDLFHRSYILPKQDKDKMSENLTAAAQSMGLFSVLMTTVTFASAFTLPGGYLSAGDAAAAHRVAGTPVLAGPSKSYFFDAFVLANALAFLCSLLSTALLLFVGVPSGDLNERFVKINIAYSFLWQAGRCLLAAFALGLRVVLVPVARTIVAAVLLLVIYFGFGFVRDGEGIISTAMIGKHRHSLSSRDSLLHIMIFVFDHFWSYIIIFGFPAIRMWWAWLP